MVVGSNDSDGNNGSDTNIDDYVVVMGTTMVVLFVFSGRTNERVR